MHARMRAVRTGAWACIWCKWDRASACMILANPALFLCTAPCFCTPRRGVGPFSRPKARQHPIFISWGAASACFSTLWCGGVPFSPWGSVPFLHPAAQWRFCFRAPRRGGIPFLCPKARQQPIFTSRGTAVARFCTVLRSILFSHPAAAVLTRVWVCARMCVHCLPVQWPGQVGDSCFRPHFIVFLIKRQSKWSLSCENLQYVYTVGVLQMYWI